jgi:hypothetical protein
VDRSWGDFWINAQVVSGNGNSTFGPGDNIRTGQNGRVLLVRGNESILISPNTEVAISKNSDDKMSMMIYQRTGSITLEVEPSDMKHFEVETPYLAAIAKGANFQVVVEDNYANVHALRGAVEVSDFRTGQRIVIMSEQNDKTSVRAVAGHSLNGAGEFAKKLQDTFRHSQMTPLTLSPIASPSADHAPLAEQTSRSGQTRGAREVYDTRKTNARATKAAIEKFFASPGQNVGAQETKVAIDKFLASSGEEVATRETKDAIKKFFTLAEQGADAGETKAKTKKSLALSENSIFAQDARPLGSIGQNGHEDAFQNSSLLQSWTIPIGIGVFVLFMAKIFKQKRPIDDRPFDYNY